MIAAEASARGNLAGILSGETQIPAGQYLATVKSVRLRADDNLVAEVVFKIPSPAGGKGQLISERFHLTGDQAEHPRRSKRALMQLAADAGLHELRDLNDLVGKEVRLGVLKLEDRKGDAVTRLIFPRPDWALDESAYVEWEFW